jgi:CDP-diacylglycerol--glycerol-3-phosphate 3-phosphatidyltransferase
MNMIEHLKPIYNRTLRPAAKVLTKTGIHPNHVTLASLIFFILAGFFVGSNQWIIALLLVIAGGIFDGLDGVLARESGQISVFGAILDSCSDRFTEIVLIFGVMIFYLEQVPLNTNGTLLCFTAITGSLMVSYVKARCEGMSVPCKSGILQRPERLILLCIGLLTGAAGMVWVLSIISVLGFITSIQRLFEAARFCRNKDESRIQ